MEVVVAVDRFDWLVSVSGAAGASICCAYMSAGKIVDSTVAAGERVFVSAASVAKLAAPAEEC